MTNTIEQRLSALPHKSAVPFRQLLASGQLSDDVVSTILDAGELAHDATKLIGFAAGFLYLRSQGIPVHDVIHMAKMQRRRVNLTWSAARWKDEHDRLSRTEALLRLSTQNIRYDVSAFLQHLPERFDGYLIQTSRRLGMEGLRQRHCVASYHDAIQSGRCAIAVVFADRQRWTIELRLTDNPEAPLFIAQIKTRHNALPAASVRRQIHEQLQINLPVPTASAPVTTDGRHLYMENLRRILPTLVAHQISGVYVTFEGSGDSGSIESINYLPENLTVGQLQIERLHTERSFDDGVWRTIVTPMQGTLDEAIDALTNDYLEETDVDWYNNDGGFGELSIDVANGTVTLEVNVRYTERATEYFSERNIATGDEI